MAKKRKKKNKLRTFLVVLLCLFINGMVFYYVGNTVKDVYLKKQEKKELKKKYVILEDEKEKLEAEAAKLQDPNYIAKYAREKFLYSKDNEYIVKIRD